ncbi:hypothetical protein P175DRAFT_0518188 [Aspergillus ochraceoroseus IBT 24754]|uniref:FCP1 homology domain-containing protein n=2 Tax=Aspergillus ochraceoroseus TaxID=138278 RepID=A0A2T5LR33_9EURO|nr:uncharacterized protein P175DRAFT_0518188 [Aspergillus ochraceoroseus IBT 24754]KKK22977.1 hypothetical protein AOCH_003405 [Aspergillus ochraceoroseus]PTU18741.1 hypothetical protein P175DRAFT_0518188 [Aspergillus ochraceoroseus IBT 24754]
MSRGGASYKLLLKYPAKHRLTLASYSPLLSSAKHSLASRNTAKSSKPAMGSQRVSTSTTSSVDNRAEKINSQGDMAPNSRGGWRPYRGRWNSKGAARENAGLDAARSRDNYNSRRGRPRHNQRSSERQLNMGTGFYRDHPERSLSPHKPHKPPPTSSQWPQSQHDPNQALANNGIPGFSVINSIPMPNHFPMAVEAPFGTAFQLPLFAPNVANQQQHMQLPQSLDQSTVNPFLLPSPWNCGNQMTAIPHFLPPNPFMNFSPLSQTAPQPMININGFGQLSAPNLSNPVRGPVPMVSGHQPQGAPFTDRLKSPKLPEQPSATKKYLHQSSLSPKLSPTPQPLLIILDLNGTLIYRKTRRFPPTFARRVGLDQFLDTLIEKYKVMIWSSSQPPTVKAVCQKLFPEPKRQKLVAEWGRDKFGLTDAQYKSKIQVYKTLDTVWSSQEIQASYPKLQQPQRPACPPHKAKKGPPPKSRWDQTNTILIDDSKLKALSEPYNLIEIPEFTNAAGIDESMIFPKVLKQLEVLSKCDDVSKMLQLWSSKASGTTSILDLDISSTVDLKVLAATPVDPAQARKEKRKARKQEKKAARWAAAAAAAAASSSASSSSIIITTTATVTANLETEANQSKPPSPSVSSGPSPSATKMEQKTNRSPSPATSSAPSENFLLDRLEESLDL